jgi:hypothetical protein
MQTLRLAVLASVLALPLVVPATAAAAGASSASDMPARGLRMSKVRDYFGEPRAVLPAVGRPPITRWLYNKYTVYFEGQTVIESVRVPLP